MGCSGGVCFVVPGPWSEANDNRPVSVKALD